LKLSYKKMSALELNTALDAARAEKSPLGQCQALSWVARNVRDQKHVTRIADSAAKAAARDEDPYKAVFPLAWPIRALLERNEPILAQTIMSEALAKIRFITPASSQSEALFLLFQAAIHGNGRLWLEPYTALMKCSLPAEHWRQARNVSDAICIVASVDYGFAKDAALALTDEKLKAKVLLLLGNSKKQAPRPFFW
jgi:hypothetical protein